ncbi:MAG: leucine-rich repeat domain-containing protein [Clostridia bacterium]|nr:leucine-rich repeat domain-containing protein [Clostridia bacterium]
MKKRLLQLVPLAFAAVLITVSFCVWSYTEAASKPQFYFRVNAANEASVIGVKNIRGTTLEFPSYDNEGRRVTQINVPICIETEALGAVTHIILPDYFEDGLNALTPDLTSLSEITLGKYQTVFDTLMFVSDMRTENANFNINIPPENKTFMLIDGCLVKGEPGYYELVHGDHIPDGVTVIGDGAFYGNTEITEITVPKEVYKIGNYAFGDCSNLTSITLEEGVKYIGECAFSGSGITSLDIPDSVVEIGGGAFNYTPMTEIPDLGGVTELPDYFFSKCKKLENAVIPEGVVSIGKCAFTDCYKLRSVTFPSTMRLIDTLDIFWYCFELENITVADGCFNFYSEGNCLIDRADMSVIASANNAVIPEGIKAIGKYAFACRSGIKSIVLPDTVTRLGYGAFLDCSDLEYLYIPASVVTVDEFVIGRYYKNTLKIYCEAESKPEGWDDDWNWYDHEVIWGATRESQ